MEELTPMMRQYRDLKAKHPDSILFFRLGDFYEMFGDDAAAASKILGLTLTRRHTTPMCGIPYHASENYIARLLKTGHRIAICEQVSQPGKGLVSREVVEVLSPGTVIEDRYLETRENNWLLALVCRDSLAGLAFLDLSTGEFKVTAVPLQDRFESLRREIWRHSPREILHADNLDQTYPQVLDTLKESSAVLNRLPSWYQDTARGEKTVLEALKVASLRTLGLKSGGVDTLAAALALEYLHLSSRGILDHVRHLEVYTPEDYLVLDEATSRNLELVRNQQEGGTGYTLLEVLDRTKTSMGARRLRKWLVHPLKSRAAIMERQGKVSLFVEEEELLYRVRQVLGPVLDLDRLCARVSMEKAHARDLLGIKASLEPFLILAETLGERFPLTKNETPGILTALVDLIEKAIHPDPPLVLGEGSLIRPGWDPELDALVEMRDHSQKILDTYLEKEKSRTGIAQLKLKYNRIIGWFLEASRLSTQDVPSHFLRKQSLVGTERFTTDELVSLESDLNRAKDEAAAREKALFLKVRSQVRDQIPSMQVAGDYMAEVDALQSLALVAWENSYCRPEVDESVHLEIIGGRHPVVEKFIPGGTFIPNNLDFTPDFRFCLLTGPNMAGKSTYLRQTALITLMAHVGSFVPATRARIGLVDRIFCRVGASDFLARGESTFLVEMNETAHILRNATSRSLVIMDEVGRGTSTHDGLAIAWAVSEHILDTIQCRTLFATHFHELTLMQHSLLKPFTMAVREEGDTVVFLRKVEPGSARRSYGIYVAQVAGLPLGVLERAGVLLAQISSQETLEVGLLSVKGKVPQTQAAAPQLDLFSPQEMAVARIQALDINRMTPLEALNTLNQIKDSLGKP